MNDYIQNDQLLGNEINTSEWVITAETEYDENDQLLGERMNENDWVITTD